MLFWQITDLFFFVFHTGLILFNLFGWMIRKTRRLNLVSLVLTGLSWTVLGIWYGLGYCPCTEWHYQVRIKLNKSDMPASYIQFLIEKTTGLDVPAQWVDIFTLVFFLSALILSIIVNLHLRKNKSHSRPSQNMK